ncbi:hypothetical protein KD050_20245 [Psychrobacillus sp. INOP01]|uniref:hypothetical protein n=1 Tax=Psychrobacillus sp. INOP01 TaxID=2829187 RepID=UPI001BA75AA6|nr:hypothetical protein [Psychrobacillus sp. INOP01]QUG41572.1 hypothetical protein KD050_20245 [Psychrobacillus sp. INOP01]
MYNKFVVTILLLSVIGFLIAIYALLMQAFGIQSGDKATIISGILSMVGGFAGALGAYFVASNQMNKQFQHEKRKEEKQSKEQILHTLKKLKILNEDIINFVEHLESEFIKLDIDDIDVILKVREYDLRYIVNKVDKINDDILRNDHNIDFLNFSRQINNMYIEIIGFTHLPIEHKSLSLEDLRQSVKKRDFKLFEAQFNRHINKIQKELIK